MRQNHPDSDPNQDQAAQYFHPLAKYFAEARPAEKSDCGKHRSDQANGYNRVQDWNLQKYNTQSYGESIDARGKG